MSWPHIEVLKEGWIQAKDCLVIQLFLNQSHAELSPLVASAIDRVFDFVGPAVIKFYLDSEGEMESLDRDLWRQLRRSQFELGEPEGGVTLRGGEEVGSFYLKYWGFELPVDNFPGWRNQLQIRLPRELAQQRLDEVVALTHTLVAGLPCSGGYVSPALACVTMRRDLWGAALRYPGVDIQDPATAHIEIGESIPGVYWITIIAPSAVQALGGIDSLRARLPPEVAILPDRKGGAVLRLGAAPAVGDSNRGDSLPLYRAVAAVLAPQLYIPARPHLFDEADEPDLDATLRWQRRFLD